MSSPHVLIVHGWQGSGPDHWQSWLATRLVEGGATVRYPDLPDPDAPVLEPWLGSLSRELDALAAGRLRGMPPRGELLVVCHSLGSLLWLHHAARGGRGVDRALLVSPPSPALDFPELSEFVPAPLDPVAVGRAAGSTRLVCATDDPYCPEGAVFSYGLPLHIACDEIADGGHLNTDAGYGPWPAAEAWCFDRDAVPVTSNHHG